MVVGIPPRSGRVAAPARTRRLDQLMRRTRILCGVTLITSRIVWG